TLAERREPYNLAVELARGKLNDVRNQLAEWRQMGLRTPAGLDEVLSRALAAFIKAATSAGDSRASYDSAQDSLAATFPAGGPLAEAYTSQVLQTRLAASAKLPTQLTIALDTDPRSAPPGAEWAQAFNAARVACPWKALAPSEGQYRWDEFDAQL